MAVRAYTATDFITKALQLLTVIDVTAVPGGEMLAQGFDALEAMVDNWRTHRAAMYATESQQFNLSANTQNYTIGPGATWDIARPSWIDFWSLIQDRTAAATSLTELPYNRVLGIKEWQRIAIKGSTASYPTMLFFDQAFNSANGRGTVKVYPIPTVSTAAVVLYLPTAIANFGTLTASFLFPAGGVLAIQTNLAVALSLYYPGSLTAEVKQVAERTFGDYKRSNVKPREAEFEAALANAGHGRRYDPYSDTH